MISHNALLCANCTILDERNKHYNFSVAINLIMSLLIAIADVTSGNKYRIRVNHDNVYEVYISDSNVVHFPLIFGEMNDVTMTIFDKIQNYATTIQLVSIENNPGTLLLHFLF